MIEVVAISSLFALWLGATIGVSVERWFGPNTERLTRLLGPVRYVIPNWNFFAPRPVRWDYHLVYRDQRADGSLTEWSEVTEISPRSQGRNAFWFPDQYRLKGVAETVQPLIRATKTITTETPDKSQTDADPHSNQWVDLDPEAIHFKSQYLLLLNLISNKDHVGDAVKTQFMLLQSTTDADEADPVFVSSRHKI